MKRLVLVVDDDADIRSGLRDLLEGAGYDVQEASNGREALGCLEDVKRVPNLILLDLMMPVLDGTGFRAAQLASPARHIPVLGYSAFGSGKEDFEVVQKGGSSDRLLERVHATSSPAQRSFSRTVKLVVLVLTAVTALVEALRGMFPRRR